MGFFSELPCVFDPDFSHLFFELKKVPFSCRCNKRGSFVLVRTIVSQYGRTTHCVSHLVSVITPFFATDCEASQCKDSISFVSPEANAQKIRIRVITTKDILFRMRGLAFHLEIFAKGIVSGIEMRGLPILEQKTRKWTDPPTTQHLHFLDAALLHGRPYRSRRHLQFSYCGHRWLHCPTAMVAVCNWVPQM